MVTLCIQDLGIKIQPNAGLKYKPGGEVLLYIGYTGMCRWKGYGFQAIYSGTGSSNYGKVV